MPGVVVPKPLARLVQSITHGNLWLCILSLASKNPVYAYALPGIIQKKFSFSPSRLMIYLVLYKLEAEGLLSSFESRKRKYYKLTMRGKKCLHDGKKVLKSWSKRL